MLFDILPNKYTKQCIENKFDNHFSEEQVVTIMCDYLKYLEEYSTKCNNDKIRISVKNLLLLLESKQDYEKCVEYFLGIVSFYKKCQ